MFSMAMWMAALVTPIQILAGDMHGLNTLQHQPAKVAAMEGDWVTASPDTGDPLILFGIPNMQAENNHYEIALPRLGSLILTHTWDGVIQGLKSFPPDNRPYVPLVFFAFRIMVALGFLMFGVGLFSLYLRWKKRLYDNRLFFHLVRFTGPAGFIALLSGWTVTEAGRQPFTVYGLLRTAQSASPIGAPGVATSLAGFAVVYLIVYCAGILFLLRLMAKPPVPGESEPPPLPTRTAGITPGPARAGQRD
jgi:cytochrome d ubiquinol oxidase subunit I